MRIWFFNFIGSPAVEPSPQSRVFGDELSQHLFYVLIRSQLAVDVNAGPPHVGTPFQHPHPLFHDLLAHIHLLCHHARREIGQWRFNMPFGRGLDKHEPLVHAGHPFSIPDLFQSDGSAEPVELQLSPPGAVSGEM